MHSLAIRKFAQGQVPAIGAVFLRRLAFVENTLGNTDKQL
jgi:hypothetical protein